MIGINRFWDFFPRFFLTLLFILSLQSILHAEENNKRIRIGIFNNAPIVYQNSEKIPEGLYVDLINEIARIEKWEIFYIFDTWDNCLKLLQENQLDLMTSIAYTPERYKQMDFSVENVLTMWGQVYVKPNSNIQNILDLNDKTIAVLKGGINGINFKKLCLKFAVTATFLEKNTYDEVIALTENGTVDAGVVNNVKGYEFEKKFKVDRSPIIFNPFSLLFAAPKEKNTELLSIIDRHLRDWKKDKDSVYYHRLDYWYGAGSSTTIPKWVIFVLTTAGCLLLGSLAIVVFLRWRIREKTSELQESEAKYRSILESMDDAAYMCSSEYQIEYINPAMEKMLGGDRIGAFCYQAIYGFEIKCEGCHLEKITKGEIVKKEIFNKNHNKNYYMSCSPVKNKDGSVSMFAIFRDITELKKAENKISKQKRLFETMFNTIPDGVVITDTERVIQLANKGMKSTFGYKPEELLGKFTKMLYADQDKYKNIGEAVFSKTAKKTENLYITRYKDMSGREFSGETFGAKLYDEDNQWIGNLGIIRDITEREQAEMRVQQAQKMDSIGTLAGGIAHDFNNILFFIIGHTEMLLEDVSEDSPLRDSLNEIYKGSLRAKDLVKQILTFSRQESNELKPMKIQPIVKEALKLIRSSIPTTIEIKQDINPDCGVIKADPTQIHQIVMNLATNAYHAMEETGGEMKVSLKEMELGALDLINLNMTPGVYACLIVADTGKGMNRELTGKIFDPFFTTKAIGKGTGMGLSVVHGIIISINGAIQVYSEPGKGTQFHVYLPVGKSHSEEQATTSKAQIQGGTEQILLVDDEEAILTMGKQMLERLGYQVTSRFSSLEALEAFRTNPDKFDLVITDMAMPNMPGDKLSVELVKIRPNIPVLLCTGFSETMSEEKAASLGIKGLLMKPIVMKDLAQKIREVLNKK